ncbi:hypothetical protein BDY19DRAFT_156824 [Irpex rosettiformis]|uniref:Uncharacterized protein n=1 Tax=Irpex rosettiformis TaxID=378272 RepID=A0ACB8U3J8_9APHY|nr:hypothetical protein BDY19DRAFT_156824 [Irpex rosettiformis]
MCNMSDMSDDSHRWSQVIQPHTALGFAALWDPEEGMVTFSIGELLDSDTASSTTIRDIPRDAFDGQSTVFTLDGLTFLGTGMRTRVPTVTFAFNASDDAQSTLDPFLRSMAVSRDRGQTHQERQPSTYLDWSQVRSVGRTIYTLARAPLERGIFSSNKPSTSNRGSTPDDEGFFEEMPDTAGTGDFSTPPVLVNLNLESHFSMTTTSTTGYVDVETPSTYSYASSLQEISPSEAWSTLRGLDYESCPNRRKPAERGRRLQKPRKYLHVGNPADPAEVLARPMYNHTVQPPTRALPHLTLPPKETENTNPLRQCVRKFKSLPKIPRSSPPAVRTHKTSVSSDTRPSTSETCHDIPPLPRLPHASSAVRGVTPPFPRRSTTPLSTYILPSPPLTPIRGPSTRSAPPSAYNPLLTPPSTPPKCPALHTSRSSPPSAYTTFSSPTPPPFAYNTPSSPTPPSPTGRGRPQLRRQRSGLAHAVVESVVRLTSKCRPGKPANPTTGSIRPSMMDVSDSERSHYYGYGYRYAV